ncbi:MAG: glucose-1-phosphate adenylyltransferase subunit GlgD [Candidatus Krumholzibacteria bacterium]|nr:glucose-1-phosphate adenylyltransferase subunit GlgD [Candidatus Krumholzibacteria bacterium]
MATFILAGGIGKRLSLLTMFRAKPAVPFAGRYRIIDFTLTNCVRSDIRSVHVLTQYISRSLIRHLGIGKPWDLDRLKGGLRILHPRLGHEGADWYKGTADAIYQNISILKKLDEKYVLILSGDHVYDMDYGEFLDYHIDSGKPASLGVIDVDPSMCREFGIATVDRDGRITKFEEKPERTDSTLASMGIYIFERDYLIDILSRMKPLHEDLDFGKHIIPKLVSKDQLAAYRYSGHWLDIGTLKSYYKASISLLANNSRLELGSQDQPILTVPEDNPPSFISRTASIHRSLVCSGCHIKGEVNNSILSPGVTVEEGAVVKDAIILHGCTIRRGAKVTKAVIDKRAVVGRGCVIGEGDIRVANVLQPGYLDFGLTLVGKKTVIPAGIRVGTNCLVSGSPENGKIPRNDIADGQSFLSSIEI